MYERDQSTMEPMSKSTVMNVVVNSNQIPVHHNKPVFEFMPQFEKEKYEILVPEGTNEKSATMAIVYFMSRVNGPAPTFEIMGDIQEWFKIGEINTQQDSNRVLSAVEIMLKKGVKVEAKEKQLPYQFTLEAKQADATASATVTVDILSFEKSETPKTSVLTESPSTEPPPVEVKTSSKPETTSTTSEDVISSTEPEITEATIGTVIVELTEGRKNIEAVIKEIEAIPETIAIDAGEEMSTSIPVGIEEEMPETEETMDNKLFTVGSSNMKTTSKAPTPASVQLLPEIDFNLNVNGVTNGQILVSESLVDGEAVPGVEIHITADQESHNELVDLELLFSDAFIVRPRRVPVGGTAQLIVANSRMLDFETAPTTFTAELRASLTYNPNMVKTKMLQFRKKDEPDHAPYFTNSFFEFEVFENSVTGEAVGQLKAHDEDVNEQLSFELFGEGSELFAINDDVLIVSCKTALPCLDREQTDAYYFALVAIDKAGYMSDPVTITIRVKDKNDNLPKLEIGDEPIRISNGALLTSAVFSVHDADLYPNYVVDVDGSAASFLEISKVSEDFYQIRPKHGSIPSTGSFVLELGVRDPTNNQADKKSVDVQVKNSFSKARFRRPRYERTITSEKIHKGNPLVQVELEGVPVDSVKFVILNSNSSWLSIDDYGGNVFVGDVPDRGVKSGHHSADIGVVDRTTKAILAQTQLLLTVIGSRKNESIFLSRFYTHTVPADQSHLNTVVELSTNEERPNIVIITDSINAWNADQKPEHFPANSIIVDRSRIMVNFEHASNLRSVQFEVASVEDFSDRALITIFFSADPKKEAERKKLMSKPLFTAPWTEDSVIIPVRLVEEAPIGQIATSLPAYDPMTGNHISNVELKGEMESFFTLDTITQNVHVAKRIDFESLTAEMRAFDLELVAGVDNYKTSAILRFQIVDIDDNTPRFGFLGQPLRNNSFAVMENSPPGTEIVRFRVSDNDELDGKQKFKYRLSGIGQDKFQIREVADSMVLVVSPVGDLDREAVDLMAIIITVEDSAGNVNTANLFITLEDQNDNAPRFQEQKVNVKLTENWQVGSTVTRLLAHDSDKNENARLHFFLENGTNPYFEVDSETGLVTTVKSLNGLARIEPYEIVVVCEDAGNPKQSARSTVMVTVVESILTNNEEKNELTIQSPPIGHVIKLSENTPANHRVYQVVAQVGSFDTADIKYSLKPITNKDEGFFNIDETSGEIFTAKRLDYENTSRITDANSIGYEFETMITLRANIICDLFFYC
ncbi:hypothetical protein L596_005260 [Steinernema carpocapsae]|nr:hypothetical protein L596_005260 [Steinernema carpocapsae]